ncbi:MAG: hypothetical protein N2645_02035 [Clostridia bacterium]|nr:hypothetical protein [Clostridia bacterium]
MRKKILLLLCFLAVYIPLVPIKPISDSDTFFHLAVGQYIYENWVPLTDPFSIHHLNYTTHEWLSELFFYSIYKNTGYTGLYILQYVFVLITFLLLYRLNSYLGKDKGFILAFTAVQNFILSILFAVIRPWLFSSLIFIFEIYLLEYYVRNKEKKVLYGLPVLSVLLANFHAGTFPFFFVIMVPYLLEIGINKRFGRIEAAAYFENRKVLLLPLAGSAALSVAAGGLNPYGFDAVKYFMLTYFSDITSNVTEWSSPDFHSLTGIVLFFIIGLTIFILSASKSRIQLSHMLLLMGTLYMSLSAVRYISYFIIAAGMVIAAQTRDMELKRWKGIRGEISQFTKHSYVVYAMVVLITFLYLTGVLFHGRKTVDYSNFPVRAAAYLKKNTDYKNIRMYNEYNVGGYLMFNGIKVFVDSRADLYVPEYNPGCTVLKDYRDTYFGRAYYKEVFQKYRIEYVLVYKGGLVDLLLQRDQSCRLLCEDGKSVLYKIID